MTTESKTQRPFHFPTSENHGRPAVPGREPIEQPASEEALDSGVEESFPANDAASVTVPKVNLPSANDDQRERRQRTAALTARR
ncbi:hypothetical protein [Variovorax sp. RCC_210]|uniref:hypothetical protein n=1 Tax=Variovorax sp. RCC_210 TaxID=3239217 RepID=UPI0035239D66